MTETTTETPVATEPAPYANWDAVQDPTTKATGPIAVTLINQYNEIRNKNASKTKGVDEIAAELVDSSTDPKVVALRQKRDELSEQISKLVLDQAKAMKQESGEPDLEAEKSAAKAMKGVLEALATFPDGKRVQALLPTVLPPSQSGIRTGQSANAGPKNDLSAVRDWARKNGFPDVKDRGRMSDEILDAYNKANGATASNGAAPTAQ